jgi:putative CocE/NonD family hydrolase
LRDVAALRAVGVTTRLVIGPWLHGEPGELKAAMQQDVAWLEHYLADGPPPSGPSVLVALQQTGIWLDFDDWPPPGIAATAFHLRSGGQLVREAAPGDAKPAMFVYDPSDPTPSVGGPMLQRPGKQADNTALEARGDVLTYTTEPFAADQDLVGPVSACIYLRTGRRHADLFVRVCDVDDKGVSRNVVDGIRRLSPETVPAADVRVGADGVMAVDVELFPTAYRVLAGHRIRLQVSGGAFPRFARNFGNGEPFGTSTTAKRCQFEVFADAEHPSHVVLPFCCV